MRCGWFTHRWEGKEKSVDESGSRWLAVVIASREGEEFLWLLQFSQLSGSPVQRQRLGQQGRRRRSRKKGSGSEDVKITCIFEPQLYWGQEFINYTDFKRVGHIESKANVQKLIAAIIRSTHQRVYLLLSKILTLGIMWCLFLWNLPKKVWTHLDILTFLTIRN